MSTRAAAGGLGMALNPTLGGMQELLELHLEASALRPAVPNLLKWKLGIHVRCSNVSQALLQSAEHACRWLRTSCSRSAQPTVCPATAVS